MLSSEELLLNVEEFKSGLADTWYAFLLKFRKLPPPGKNMKELRQILGDSDGSMDCLVALDGPTVPAGPAVLAVLDPDIACDDADEICVPAIAADIAADIAVDGEEAAPPAPPASPAAIADDGEEDGPVCEWPATLGGVNLRVVKAKRDSSHHYFSRLAVTCSNPGHPLCNRSRSTELQVGTYGRLAAVYYLGSWLEANHLSQAEHKAYQPSAAIIRNYIARYPA